MFIRRSLYMFAIALILGSGGAVAQSGSKTAGQPGSQSATQPVHNNPWAPMELGPLPPIASLSDGVWLKGELHLHSSHSHDASNNSVGKVIAFCNSAGIDYLCITDHDNHVGGDVAHNTWADPEF